MLLTPSPEFISLCRSQVILAQGLGASFSIVYLAKDLVNGGDTELIPLIVYPESAVEWSVTYPWIPPNLPSPVSRPLPPAPSTHSLSGSSPVSLQRAVDPILPTSAWNREQSVNPESGSSLDSEQPVYLESVEPLSRSTLTYLNESVNPDHQIVLPLVHEGTAIGLLVSYRNDRPWNPTERREVDHIARTLALGYVLEQRTQWLMEIRDQRQSQERHHRFLMDALLHQFRNPLTALRTFGKLLMKRLVSYDPNREVAVSIVRESERLQELLTQIEQVTKEAVDVKSSLRLNPSLQNYSNFLDPLPSSPEREQSEENPDLVTDWLSGNSLTTMPINLDSVLSPLLMTAGAIAQERGLTLEIGLSQGLPDVQVNGKALREVLNNLIENALKYTPTNGLIQIQSASGHPDGLSGKNSPLFLAVAISDTGPGIPPEDLPHLFEPYYRGIQSQGNIPGTGLGMAIAHQLLSRMGGTLQVFSPGKLCCSTAPGTTVVTWLPTSSQ